MRVDGVDEVAGVAYAFLRAGMPELHLRDPRALARAYSRGLLGLRTNRAGAGLPRPRVADAHCCAGIGCGGGRGVLAQTRGV